MRFLSSSRCDSDLIRDTILLISIIIIWLVVVIALSKGIRTDIDCPLTPDCIYVKTYNEDYDIYVDGKYICSASVGFIPFNGSSCYLKIEDDNEWCEVSLKCDNFSRKLLKGTLLTIFGVIVGIAIIYIIIRISLRWWDWYHEIRIYQQERESGNDGDKELLNSASYE